MAISRFELCHVVDAPTAMWQEMKVTHFSTLVKKTKRIESPWFQTTYLLFIYNVFSCISSICSMYINMVNIFVKYEVKLFKFFLFFSSAWGKFQFIWSGLGEGCASGDRSLKWRKCLLRLYQVPATWRGGGVILFRSLSTSLDLCLVLENQQNLDFHRLTVPFCLFAS